MAEDKIKRAWATHGYSHKQGTLTNYVAGEYESGAIKKIKSFGTGKAALIAAQRHAAQYGDGHDMKSHGEGKKYGDK